MFGYIGLCLTAKRSGKRSCVVLPLQEFDRGAMTVLIHGMWSSTDVVFILQEFENLRHVYPEKLCHCTIAT